MLRRSNPWPALVDLFAALLLPVFGGLIIVSADLPKIQEEKTKIINENNNSNNVIKVVQKKIGTTASTPEEMKIAIEEYRKLVAAEARRGKPKCQVANTIVEVSQLDGQLELHLQAGVEKLLNNLQPPPENRFIQGQVLTNPNQIESFLLSIGHYYGSHDDCRFDYRLIYKTDKDYRIARGRFERYFYPESISASISAVP
jgi:hypothetical protein